MSFLFLIYEPNFIFVFERYAAAKPPGAASSGPKPKYSFIAEPYHFCS
jgi:hypothetical protein